MTAKLSASADGTKVLIGTAAEDALQIDSVAKTITPVAPYQMNGNGPAFAAVADGSQTIPSTPTKILLQTERFDTDNCFANSRFTPTVAGYYQFNAGLAASATSSNCGVYIQKNGVTQASLFLGDSTAFCSALIYMNGTTDYAEAFGFLGTPGLTTNADFGGTQFSGALVRTA